MNNFEINIGELSEQDKDERKSYPIKVTIIKSKSDDYENSASRQLEFAIKKALKDTIKGYNCNLKVDKRKIKKEFRKLGLIKGKFKC